MKETNMSDLALQGGADPVHPVDEKLPGGRLAALGMQHAGDVCRRGRGAADRRARARLSPSRSPC